MKITSIQQQKKNKKRYSIFLDGEYSFSVSGETLLKSALKDGMELTENDIKDISKEETNSLAFESALRLLDFAARSKKELIERLKRKKIPQEAIDSALARVESAGFINDDKFARDYARNQVLRGKGPIAIRFELKRKGIDAETITDIMDGIKESSEDTLESAVQAAERKLKTMKNQPPEVIARRLTGFLARRGFAPDTIRTILKDIKKDIIEE